MGKFCAHQRFYQRTSALSGFTLVELMIAMGIFVLLMGVVVNIFITSLQKQRSVVALMAANDNASIAIEQMAREVRTGTIFSLIPDALSPKLHFTNARGEVIEYRYDDISKAIARNVDGLAFLPITGNNVTINSLRFTIFPFPADLAWPPRITMNIQVGFTDRFLTDVKNDLQTTVSARDI